MKTVWTECTLGDVLTLKRGYDLPRRKRVKGIYPIVSSSGVTGWHNEAKVPAPGVVTGRYGTLGEVFYMSQDFWPLNTSLYVQDFKGNDPRFISYFLRTLGLGARSGAAAVPGLNRNVLHMLHVRRPSVDVQRKIAAILSAYDGLIENNTRRNAILEDMAEMLYREWFVRFRFPGNRNVRLVDSPAGTVPEGWTRIALGDALAVLETGSRPKGGVGDFKEGVPSIGAESVIGAGRFDYSKTKYVPVEYFAKMKKGVLEDRDVLVYKDGGKPGDFRPHVSIVGNGYPFKQMAINSHVYRLRAEAPISQEFLYYHLSSEAMMHWMHLYGTGAAVPSIARRDLKRLPLLIPAKTVLREFDTIVQDLMSQILLLARSTHSLRLTRDLLLPKLVSGELDVSDLDIKTGEEAA